MFSTFEIRLKAAKNFNPELFKHVTLQLDGHDTRATYGAEDKSEGYSYKLKKSGLRTQVCIDITGMALFVSKSSPCKMYNDGTMMKEMKMQNMIHPLDCIALDGGYTQFLESIIEESGLSFKNFSCPIRKKRHLDLTSEETNYNSMFGTFRSMIENTFAELGCIFEKHNNRVPVRVDKKRTYNIQMKLCLLLLNVKKFVKRYDIQPASHHSLWTDYEFDYPGNKSNIQDFDSGNVLSKLEYGVELNKLQEEFLGMEMDEEDESPLVLEKAGKRKTVVTVEIPSY
ncbi:hypothetical protein EC957_010425, partial [Mortierella hygrophila]